ncbi:MAG TPA: serine hydrolase [Flavobacteriaceae bacterium]|nr:serine hydrolase [Flavobacteriaceae bacterium]MCB9212034.1 serine hydrolase [Alteromonas sp.]HPF09871.1 serine hydrolase [Flavobacteriaceae bacterium]HQU19968.1 serine hydrolase [Flavobacteriaceae bacterium]HQU64046.1 serine hydrolase [Flavobacteriaceae bacterium]
MKRLKKFFKWLLILSILVIAVLYLTDTDYLIKAVRTIYLKGHTTAYLEDYQQFDNDTLRTGTPQPWALHRNYNTSTETEKLTQWNNDLGTVAFLIFKNDSIWFEKYYDGYDKASKSNSFSMVKSMVSAMLGKAIMEGHIKGLDQPVSDFYPEFSEGMAKQMTVGDLSSMASGTNWDEAYYSPFSITTRAYFDDDLRKVILGLKVVNPPGKSFKYASGDTELLAMVLEKATGKRLVEYLSEVFWEPMGAEHEALWQVDSKESDMVKAFCCLASNARDFARFGKLYKDHGRWNGKQLLDSSFIAKSVTPRFPESPQYGYGWWLYKTEKHSFFMMRGHLGQYVIVEPNDNIMIVRLGHRKSPDAGVGKFTEDIRVYLEEAYRMLEIEFP